VNESSVAVTVHILDRDYVVACAPEERLGLIEAAQRLDADMRQLRNASRTASLDRIAVLAALNIAHELIQERHRSSQGGNELTRELDALRQKLDTALEVHSAKA
jgi:cell division protein ZapA